MDLVAAAAAQPATAPESDLLGGFWTNVLNPKVAMFFLAFVPQFITPDIDNKALAFCVAGPAVQPEWHVGQFGLGPGGRLDGQARDAVQRGMHWLDRAAGVMFIAFGLKLAFTDNPAN
jgi:threonine/homoserine/homoserine lactone efflux protein